jgi:hypothetical protein
MVEISLSGSGEGPGWATAPGYSTAAFSPPPILGILTSRLEGARSGPGWAQSVATSSSARAVARKAYVKSRRTAFAQSSIRRTTSRKGQYGIFIDPHVVVQFAHKVAERDYQGRDVKIYADVRGSLNQRPWQQFIPGDVDLLAQPVGYGHYDWIVPLGEQLLPGDPTIAE